MDIKTMLALMVALERISKAVKISSEELEIHIDDPMVSDYFANLQVVKNELDSTIYAIEQSLSSFSDESNH